MHNSDCPSSSMSATKEQTCPMPDWSLLPEELLHIIAKYLEDDDYCFDVVHARSVCTSWRSIFPFPSCLLRPKYHLPAFSDESQDFCTLEKIPVFLFRVLTPPSASHFEYFLGDIGRDNSDDHMVFPSPVQCSVKLRIPGLDPTSINIRDCQILSLGYQYRMIGWDAASHKTDYRGVAFLPLDKDGGGDFVVLLNYSRVLLVLRSSEMRWYRLEELSTGTCSNLFTFRGRFYAIYMNGDMFAIDPYSLEATPLLPTPPHNHSQYLVPCGNDEFFMVEKIIPLTGIISFHKLACKVSRLDEEVGKWVEVNDLGNRVLFFGDLGNCSFSANRLPDGCGVSGNSLLFTNGPGYITYAYKYGAPTENAEDDLNFWRYFRENQVMILSTSPPIVALRIER
ncbi:hypothetical protein CARUB_v10024494mg [Capsella rubella]|uniref:Uncharacterized protein n=1 Tax=Capsella rubella TaxID=81985 RepID=R0FYY8_9BRAS|nr:F-box/kelch-repeat protein At1g64840 [Capsella rubella]XP_023640021.1 F-box/kelch-repeat protein At1g64840 [Capsella rubella]EOA28297.1 hypothetical protein CARUB_v10024494mg [Capsella rubella]